MRVMHLPAFGIDNLAIIERDVPEPGPGEVLVRFGAASVNYRDYQIVTGEFAPTATLPIVPCSDGGGFIAAVGDGVTEFAVGDSVSPLFFPEWQSGDALTTERSISVGLEVPGALRDFGLFRVHQLVKVAPHLSAAEAACFPCAGLTAWTCLTEVAGVGPGDWVLTTGTGGVAIFALQFAKALGARVIVTSGSDEKIARARELGADFTINYREVPDWGRVARRIADGVGVKCVVETGGEGTLPQSVTALRRNGWIGCVGYLAGIGLGLTVYDLIERNANLHGMSVGHREGFLAMMDWVAKHEIRPVIHREYAFEDAAAALADLHEGAHFGKLVVRI
jgi:NADPH:quinone reductase-like Zn-dependent oxidoreductase